MKKNFNIILLIICSILLLLFLPVPLSLLLLHISFLPRIFIIFITEFISGVFLSIFLAKKLKILNNFHSPKITKNKAIIFSLFSSLLIIIIQIFFSFIIQLLGISLPQQEVLQLSNMGEHNIWTYINLFVFISLLLPIMEEMFFRGFLYNIFTKLFNKNTPLNFIYSSLCSSFIFGMLHLQSTGGLSNIFYTIVPFASGIILCYTYNKTGSIIYSIISHSCVNFINVLLVLTV